MKLLNLFVSFLRPKSSKREDCNNIVQSMARCKQLYKTLSVLAHPDKHPNKSELATEIMNEINANRFNYSELIKLEKKIQEELICN